MGARSSQSRGPGLNKTDGHLLEYFRQTFGAGGGSNSGPQVSPVVGHTATGGVISDYKIGSDVYRAHIFTSSGTFAVTALGNQGNTVEYLLVAGGGGGGTNQGGGGGAGGYRTTMPEAPGGPGTSAESALTVSAGPTSYPVIIGAGGAGKDGSTNLPGVDGTDSTFDGPTFTAVTSTGGGGGGSYSSAPGRTGGSGGGSGAAGPSSATPGGAAASPTQGYVGGAAAGSSSNHRAGGGGGAGAAGVNGVPGGASGPGGVGKTSTIAYGPTNAQTIAGGGGGSSEPGSDPTRGNHPSNPNGAGGAPFGGGLGGGAGAEGLFSSGGGGGGAGAGPNVSGKGGSGIAVIRYKIASVATAKASGGAISFYGSKTIHTFTNSGAFVVDGAEIPSAEIFVVAGGGGGGGYASGDGGSGGGGAGGVVYHPGRPLAASTTFPVSVGAGGKNAAKNSSHVKLGLNGGNTVFTDPSSPGTITAVGGGGGRGQDGNAASNGGSGGGGGGGGSPPGGAGGTATQGNSGGGTGYGYAGGAGQTGPSFRGGGGGGAGGVGAAGPAQPGNGHGGSGIQAPPSFRNPASSIGDPGTYGGGTAPTPGGFWFAGGGGSSGSPYNNAVGTGGAGGAGSGIWKGSDRDIPTAAIGKVNTGGGGGGYAIANPYVVNSGNANGGSGIVLIAYPT